MATNSNPFTVSILEATALMQAAGALAPGGSTTTIGGTDGTVGLTNDALYSIQWMNRFHYDHSHGTAHLIGKEASSTGGERTNNVYDAGNNAWTTSGSFHIGGSNETGHIYESFAFDPVARTVFTGRWNQADIQSWTHGDALTDWEVPTTAPWVFSMTNGVQPVLLWHPTLFGPNEGGLLAFRLTSSGVDIVAWRKSTDTWSILGTSDDGSTHGAMEYVRSGDYAICTVAAGSTFRIGAGSNGTPATPTQIENPPIPCRHAGGSSNVGILIDDPSAAAGPYILEKAGTNRVWKYSGGAWVLQPFTHPFPSGSPSSSTNWCVASLHPTGAFWCLKNTAGSRLWRPDA